MFKNYLRITFRSLWKNRVISLINILGLGIALAVCIVAFFNHMFYNEFDRTHENFDKIYRVNSLIAVQGKEEEYGIVPATLGLEIKKEISGIQKSARLMRADYPVKEGEDIFSAYISCIDPEFLEIFTLPIVLGDQRSIDSQGNVLVSRSMATKLFGEANPIGKSISIINDRNQEFIFTVSAVFADLPDNSSFWIDILTHFDNFLLMRGQNDVDWKTWITALFIQVPNKSLLPSITQSMDTYLPVQNRAREDFSVKRFKLVPLKEVGANSMKIASPGLFTSVHPAAVYTPSIMAIFILLLSCFNFANTTIATFSKRLKEIGLRKAFGGQKIQLITQFMFETLIICFLAILVGITIAKFLVPAYSNLWEYMSIELTFSKYAFFWLFLLLLLLFTGFIAGVYPAMHVSSYSPVKVLKGNTTPFKALGMLSSVLLLLQFAISIMALVLSITFTRNSDYQKTIDLGYDRDKLITVPIASEYFTSYRNEIMTNPKIISAEGTRNHIGFSSYRGSIRDEEKQLEADILDIGPGYAGTMGLRLIEGHLFDESSAAADRSNSSIIVNQKLVNDFGWQEAVGRVIHLNDTTRMTVTGVVDDFYRRGVWEKIEPSLLRLSAVNQYNFLIVKANPGNISEVLEYLNLKWKRQITNHIFEGMRQEDIMHDGIEINNSILKTNIFLAIVAILLSLLGMYNMLSLDIIRRTKEMGIRKILGAPVPLIMFLVSKKFLVILLIASILGCMGGYYLSLLLLDSIWDYYVKINMGVLVFASAIMFTATIITVIFKIARAAMQNPIVSLRYE